MIYPPIQELTQDDKINRYELVIATAKCARKITDEYVAQRELAERAIASKEVDKSIANLVKKEFRDQKAVRTAINRIYNGEYDIVSADGDNAENADTAVEESKLF